MGPSIGGDRGRPSAPPWVPAGIAPPSSKAKPGDPQTKSGALAAGGVAQRGGKDGDERRRPAGSGGRIVAEGLDVKALASGERHAGGRNGRSRDSREATMLKPLLSAVDEAREDGGGVDGGGAGDEDILQRLEDSLTLLRQLKLEADDGDILAASPSPIPVAGHGRLSSAKQPRTRDDKRAVNNASERDAPASKSGGKLCQKPVTARIMAATPSPTRGKAPESRLTATSTSTTSAAYSKTTRGKTSGKSRGKMSDRDADKTSSGGVGKTSGRGGQGGGSSKHDTAVPETRGKGFGGRIAIFKSESSCAPPEKDERDLVRNSAPANEEVLPDMVIADLDAIIARRMPSPRVEREEARNAKIREKRVNADVDDEASAAHHILQMAAESGRALAERTMLLLQQASTTLSPGSVSSSSSSRPPTPPPVQEQGDILDREQQESEGGGGVASPAHEQVEILDEVQEESEEERRAAERRSAIARMADKIAAEEVEEARRWQEEIEARHQVSKEEETKVGRQAHEDAGRSENANAATETVLSDSMGSTGLQVLGGVANDGACRDEGRKVQNDEGNDQALCDAQRGQVRGEGKFRGQAPAESNVGIMTNYDIQGIADGMARQATVGFPQAQRDETVVVGENMASDNQKSSDDAGDTQAAATFLATSPGKRVAAAILEWERRSSSGASVLTSSGSLSPVKRRIKVETGVGEGRGAEEGSDTQKNVQEAVTEGSDTQKNVQEAVTEGSDTQKNVQEAVTEGSGTQKNVQEAVEEGSDTQASSQRVEIKSSEIKSSEIKSSEIESRPGEGGEGGNGGKVGPDAGTRTEQSDAGVRGDLDWAVKEAESGKVVQEAESRELAVACLGEPLDNDAGENAFASSPKAKPKPRLSRDPVTNDPGTRSKDVVVRSPDSLGSGSGKFVRSPDSLGSGSGKFVRSPDSMGSGSGKFLWGSRRKLRSGDVEGRDSPIKDHAIDHDNLDTDGSLTLSALTQTPDGGGESAGAKIVSKGGDVASSRDAEVASIIDAAADQIRWQNRQESLKFVKSRNGKPRTPSPESSQDPSTTMHQRLVHESEPAKDDPSPAAACEIQGDDGRCSSSDASREEEPDLWEVIRSDDTTLSRRIHQRLSVQHVANNQSGPKPLSVSIQGDEDRELAPTKYWTKSGQLHREGSRGKSQFAALNAFLASQGALCGDDSVEVRREGGLQAQKEANNDGALDMRGAPPAECEREKALPARRTSSGCGGGEWWRLAEPQHVNEAQTPTTPSREWWQPPVPEPGHVQEGASGSPNRQWWQLPFPGQEDSDAEQGAANTSTREWWQLPDSPTSRSAPSSPPPSHAQPQPTSPSDIVKDFGRSMMSLGGLLVSGEVQEHVERALSAPSPASRGGNAPTTGSFNDASQTPDPPQQAGLNVNSPMKLSNVQDVWEGVTSPVLGALLIRGVNLRVDELPQSPFGPYPASPATPASINVNQDSRADAPVHDNPFDSIQMRLQQFFDAPNDKIDPYIKKGDASPPRARD